MKVQATYTLTITAMLDVEDVEDGEDESGAAEDEVDSFDDELMDTVTAISGVVAVDSDSDWRFA